MSIHTNLIRSFGYLIHLDEAEKEFISSLFVSKQYQKNDHFLREGQVCREAGFIEKGLIRYYNIKDSGEEVTLDFGKENDWTCNYESFLDHSPSLRNIECLEPTEILTLSYENLQRIYNEVKEGQKFGRLICEFLYLQAIKKLNSLYTDLPEQRYLHFVNDYPDLQQRVPQYYISSFVGVKPPSLSRIRKRLSL
ncbi:Crp/Fnr family transcriptional regulator [Chitinophaga arvensicola]|uniref:cAMP-binding domain of CRP or a regulatory subunit of cAMP-dependent protein kinases n=1 Tax=Chitinophaga arvensicola TaxID=29529 RepID=A0A1I0QDJ1_9BACT|nr:Crp/Fnr family transcriptional regulator [Chitinophaga arvensicola]SEW25026.1 cAMP-binding domain of CRP or a regulatory subunit of cAMP-dependent protein kinases [Chitinophaga arvensicola]